MDDDFEMYDEDESNQSNLDLYSMQDPEPSYQNNQSASVLMPMYEEDNATSYEEELKTATPIIEEKKEETPIVEELPKEVTYTDDFMDYDPMLHNDLQTDGDYIISSFDPNQNSSYVPEKTDFDSNIMMETHNEENIEVEQPKQQVEEEPPVPEDYNTSGMMTYDTNNVDTFNDGKTPTQTVVTRFIFDEMKNSDETMPQETPQPEIEQKEISQPMDRGAIPIYNRQDEIDKNIKNQNSNRKTYEMIGMVILFALLILLISFFPDINKIFNNLKK